MIFDCNTCPYSKPYNERIIKLNKKYASQGFPVITINADDPNISSGDSFKEMAAQAKRKGYDFPYLVDETQDVARAFGATNTPHVFVLKNDGGAFPKYFPGRTNDGTDVAYSNVRNTSTHENADAITPPGLQCNCDGL